MTEVINGAATTYSYTYDEDNRIVSETANGITVTYTYDAFGRLANRTVKNGDTVIQTITPTYSAGSLEGSTTGQVSSYNGYTYTYDDNGNILTVSDGTYTTSYEYDSANQLIRENNQALNFTHTWTYDNAGNITSRTEYAFNDVDLQNPLETVIYEYTDANWGDLLTIHDGNAIIYDELGNPLDDSDWTYTWQNGRQLAAMSNSNRTWTFTYDANGMRTSRSPGYERGTYTYTYNGSKLTQMEVEGYTFRFSYDASGTPVSFTMGNSLFFYETNLQGDVVGIWDQDGNRLVHYAYDAWGNVQILQNHQIAEFNPLLYRGYVYDFETGFYYVSSRYYDPEIGRWISPEPNVYAGAFDSGSGLVGYNIYAYCANNPVNFSDPTGEFILTALIVGVVAGAVIGGAIGGTVAYNSAKSSGLEGSDLFWATAGGVGKGALIGGVAGGLVGATGGVVTAYGATSVAGTAMITSTATITAKAMEVTALQAKKSTNDGDNGWQIANDCIDSIFGNGGKIISPALTKAGTTSATYVATDLIKHKVVSLGFNAFLHSTGGKVLPYGFAAYAWGHTAYSIFVLTPSQELIKGGMV